MFSLFYSLFSLSLSLSGFFFSLHRETRIYRVYREYSVQYQSINQSTCPREILASSSLPSFLPSFPSIIFPSLFHPFNLPSFPRPFSSLLINYTVFQLLHSVFLYYIPFSPSFHSPIVPLLATLWVDRPSAASPNSRPSAWPFSSCRLYLL